MTLSPVFAAGEVGTISYLLNGFLIFLSFLLMLIILIQKGKGGGLAGAFGGAGGSSAFGSKAGDLFTKITLYFAAIWVLVIMINVKVNNPMTKEETAVIKEPSATPGDQPKPADQPTPTP